MTNKLMVFATFLFISFTLISFILEEEQGLAATRLTIAVDDNDTTFTVSDARGFFPIDFLLVGSEIVCYTAHTDTTFTGLTRGCKGTDASPHAVNTKVFNQATGAINQLVGFNIAETLSSSGIIRSIITVPPMLGRAIPQLVMWNYSYLEGDVFGFPLVYLKYIIFYPISAGFLLAFVTMMLQVFMGTARIFVP